MLSVISRDNHMTSGWGCCHLRDRLTLGHARTTILVRGMVSGIRAEHEVSVGLCDPYREAD